MKPGVGSTREHPQPNRPEHPGGRRLAVPAFLQKDAKANPTPGIPPGDPSSMIHTPAQMRSYKISVLVFLRNAEGDFLLIRRRREPNLGQWSPIGGKLEMGSGESPHECAVRETREEVGLDLRIDDLHLFSMIAEKSYEGGSHWLMFLFDCRRPIDSLPPAIDEGSFAFHSRSAIDRLSLPETDRVALWPVYDRHRRGFVALRADCTPGTPLAVHVDESIGLCDPPVSQTFRH